MMTSVTCSGSTSIAFSPSDDRLDDRASALGRHRGIEPGVEDEGAVRTLDHPDEVGERLVGVVRIAADVVLVSRPIVMTVADRVDLVDVVGHQEWMSRPRVSGPSQMIIAVRPESTMAALMALTSANPRSCSAPSRNGIKAPIAAAA